MSYSMPKVQVGDPVCWHVDAAAGDQYANAAIVTAVHPEHIDVIVFMSNRNPVPRTSVRHVDDPKLNEIDKQFRLEQGGWDYSPFHKRVQAMEGALSDRKQSRNNAKA